MQMTPETSASALGAWLTGRKLELQLLSVPEFVNAALAFYKEVRCAGLASDAGSDMLLFQWGVYDWGDGEQFELDITRQFIERGKEDDDAISQLRMTAYFPPEDLRHIEAGNQWCEHFVQLERFRSFIENSIPYKVAGGVASQRIVIEWSPV